MDGMVNPALVAPQIADLTKQRWTYSVELSISQPSLIHKEEFKIEFAFEATSDPNWPIEISAKRLKSPDEASRSTITSIMEQSSWLTSLLSDPLYREANMRAKPVGAPKQFTIHTPFEEAVEVLDQRSTKLPGGMVREWFSANYLQSWKGYMITVDRMVGADGMPVFADVIISSQGTPNILIRLTQLSRKAKARA